MSVNFLRNIQGSWTTDKSPARTIKEIVREPWCPELLKDKMDKDGYIHPVVEVELCDLVRCGSIDEFSDLVEARILHSSCERAFDDSTYEVVGFNPELGGGWGSVYIKVHGYVGGIVEAWEEQLADETNKFADGVMTTSGDQ